MNTFHNPNLIKSQVGIRYFERFSDKSNYGATILSQATNFNNTYLSYETNVSIIACVVYKWLYGSIIMVGNYNIVDI